MTKIYFDKLYRYERKMEHCNIAIPVKAGELKSVDNVAIFQNGKAVPVQTKVTATHKDGSVRYMFIRFMADLPANKGTVLECDYNSDKKNDYKGIVVEQKKDGYFVDSDGLIFSVKNNSNHIFEILDDGREYYDASQFEGPYLIDKDNTCYDMHIDNWSITEQGRLCTILTGKGSNIVNTNTNDKQNVDFEITITAYAGKQWVEVGYRIINTTDSVLEIKSLVFYLKANKDSVINANIHDMKLDTLTDSTGCGDGILDNSSNEGPIFHTRGITELELIEKKAPVENIRTFVGSSNYKTDFYIGKDGTSVNKYVDAHFLVKEANEHFAEVLYGTFMADRTDEKDGVCITVFQAQQNYPKAVKADENGIAVMLVPEGIDSVKMQSGMLREQKFLIHFHSPKEGIKELDNRSLIYQMPDRPYISPEVFKNSGVMIDVFPDEKNDDVEIALIGKADSHSRCFGMMTWGDTWDAGYTKQGRGNGRYVWSNNEYDYPHSCALQYARTGIRRFLDYLFVSARHWMDVDVCHYSKDPLKLGGQWEHTAGHCENGVMVCSHEWVEGLFDYYHFSGDIRGFETAIGIGENVLKLLDTPMYATPGEANARETGWALRTLTALYIETHDKKWLSKCEWIIDSFKVWEEEYGNWLAPYTDNTTIRVGFMISVAVGSLMRYYREFPSEDIKQMLIRAIDDLTQNCLLDCGLFYYKELPSLSRLGNNTLLLESLSIGYELTGNAEYLKYGFKTFKKAINDNPASTNGSKQIVEDAVCCAGGSTKNFAQSFIPLITYYKDLVNAGLWNDEILK
jgi:hypothetical protein